MVIWLAMTIAALWVVRRGFVDRFPWWKDLLILMLKRSFLSSVRVGTGGMVDICSFQSNCGNNCCSVFHFDNVGVVCVKFDSSCHAV